MCVVRVRACVYVVCMVYGVWCVFVCLSVCVFVCSSGSISSISSNSSNSSSSSSSSSS